MKFRNFKRPKIRIRRPRVRIRWRKKTSKWVIGVVSLFFIALLAFQLVLMNYAKSILQNIINMQVEQLTGGRYSSGFGEIEIGYTGKNLIIKNFRLSPQSGIDSVKDSESGSNQVYDLFIPEIRINGINLRKAYWKKILEIESIEVEAPLLTLNTSFDDPESGSSNLLKKDLYELLPSAIEELRVGTVQIQGGSLYLNFLRKGKKSKLHFSSVDLAFRDFILEEDGAGEEDKILFTDQFFLEADSVNGTLADESYRIQLEALKISSSDSSAFAGNMKITPLKSISEFLNDDSARNRYEVEFPLFYMYGLDIKDLFNHQNLTTKEVTVVSPSFKLLNLRPLPPGEKESFKIEDLYPAIDQVLSSIQVNHLILRNGKLEIEEYKKGVHEKLSTRIQLADIQNFVLDSASGRNEQKILFSDKITFNLSNYRLRLSDELHLLQADELLFSTEKSEISAKGFKIVPDTLSTGKELPSITYYAGAPVIHLHGVDMLRAYNSNNLHIDSLQLREPSLTLTGNGKRKEQKEFREEDLYVLIEDFLYTLSVDKISLRKGLLKIRNLENSEDAFNTSIRSAGLWNFRLDSGSAYQMNKLFYADNFELEIENYEQLLPDGLHKIRAEAIGVSTLTDRIYINDLQIFTENNTFPFPALISTNAKTLLNIEVPSMILEGVDILNAYLNKKLYVKTVRIPEPSLQLGSLAGNQSDRVNIMTSSDLYALGKDFLEEIHVESLRLENGRLDMAFFARQEVLLMSGRQTDIIVDNFRFDSLTSSNPKRLFFADNVIVQVEDFETQMPDGIHTIKAGSFLSSTREQKMVATDVDISTRKESYTDEELLLRYGRKGFLNLHLPEIRILGLNFDEAYYQDMLEIDSVYASRPDVKYTYVAKSSLDKRKRKINLRQTDFYDAVSPFFGLVAVDNLILEDGKFRAVKQEGNLQQETTLLDGITLKMEGYKVDSSEIKNSQHFFYARDIKLSIDEYKQELLDDVHTLTAKRLQLSTALQQVKAEDVHLKPKENIKILASLTSGRYFAELPKLEVNGIGFDKVYKDNQLVIDELQLESPDIRIRLTTTESEKKKDRKRKVKLKDYDLYDLIRGNLESLEIKSASLVNGKGSFIRLNGEKRFKIDSDQFSAQVTNFKIDGSGSKKDKLFFSDDVQVSVEGFERKLADSLHLLRIGDLHFSTQQNKLIAKDTRLIPRSGPGFRDFMIQEGKNRLFNVLIPETEFSGLHPEQVQFDSLRLESIVFKSPEVEIINYQQAEKKIPKKNKAEEGWQKQILEKLKVFKTDEIIIENASLAITTPGEKDTSTFTIGNIHGLATNFVLDSLSGKQQEKTLFSDRLQLQIKEYTTPFDNDLYQLKISSIKLDSRESRLVADSVTIVPLVSRDKFARQKGYETDQFTFRNGQTVIKNLNYQALFSNGSFHADSLIMDGFNLFVYRDKRQPFPENHFPNMPQDMIRNLNTSLNLGGIALKNGYIRYEEQVKGPSEPGFMELTRVNIKSDALSNKPTFLRSDTTTLALDCYLMGTGHLEAFFKIPFGDTLNRHRYYGTLDEMHLPDFNPILERTVFIKIREGHAEKIDFEVRADREGATGEMQFRYRNLKVALVNKRTGRSGGLVKEMVSFLANFLVVETNNTEGGEKPLRDGKIVFVRDENRSVVNYWVKTMVHGFKSSIGL